MAADLARYRSLSPVERWMMSDVGRSSLSGAATVLDAMGGLTAAALMASRPVAIGEVSRGRARLYLQRAMANGLIVAADAAAPMSRDAALTLAPRFRAVMGGVLTAMLPAAATLLPDAAPGVARLSDFAFARAVAGRIGGLIQNHDLFPLESPIRLFQARDGGARVLEALILLQPPDRGRLLEACAVSHSALARAGMCSRVHVITLLRDAADAGLLSVESRRLTISPALSDAVELYFAGCFATAAAATIGALAAA